MKKDNLFLKYSNESVIWKLLNCHGDIDCILKKLDTLNIYDYDFTLEEIGDILQITRERVRQIEQSALKKLKHPKIGRILKNYIE